LVLYYPISVEGQEINKPTIFLSSNLNRLFPSLQNWGRLVLSDTKYKRLPDIQHNYQHKVIQHKDIHHEGIQCFDIQQNDGQDYSKTPHSAY
jgi:hypothetical protein